MNAQNRRAGLNICQLLILPLGHGVNIYSGNATTEISLVEGKSEVL